MSPSKRKRKSKRKCLCKCTENRLCNFCRAKLLRIRSLYNLAYNGQ